MRATINDTSRCFDAMPDHATLAVGATRRERLDSGAYRGVVTILAGAEIVEIEYLDIDKVERLASG